MPYLKLYISRLNMTQALPKSFNQVSINSLFFAIEKENINKIHSVCLDKHPLQVFEIEKIIAPLLQGKMCCPKTKQVWKTKILKVVQNPDNAKRDYPSRKGIFGIGDIVQQIVSFCSHNDLRSAACVSHAFHLASLHAPLFQMQDTVRRKSQVCFTHEMHKEWKLAFPSHSPDEVFRSYSKVAQFVKSVEIDNDEKINTYIPFLKEHFSHVTHLSLCDELRLTTFTKVLECFPQLEELEILCGITENFLSHAVDSLEKYCKNLTSISIIDCNDPTASILRLAWGFPKLKSISLMDCPGLSDHAVMDLARYCPLLESLNISGSNSITDAAFVNLMRFDLKLKHLDFSECPNLTTVHICQLIENCKDYLQCLNLEDIPHLDIVRVINTLRHCRHLTAINFGGQTALTDEMIIPLIQSLPLLHGVAFSRCKLLTDKTIKALQAHCPRLSNLAISRSLISDEGLALLVELPNLLHFDISECPNVTNEGIILFCSGHRDLQTLKLPKRKFDFRTNFAIAHFCPKLESLHDDDESLLNKVFLYESSFLRNELTYKPVTPWGVLFQSSYQSLLALSEKEIADAKASLQKVLSSLTQEDRDMVYYYAWQWNGCPQEPDWGINNALNDLSNFNDSLRSMIVQMSEGKDRDAIQRAEYRLASAFQTPFKTWRKMRFLEVRRADAIYQCKAKNSH